MLQSCIGRMGGDVVASEKEMTMTKNKNGNKSKKKKKRKALHNSIVLPTDQVEEKLDKSTDEKEDRTSKALSMKCIKKELKEEWNSYRVAQSIVEEVVRSCQEVLGEGSVAGSGPTKVEERSRKLSQEFRIIDVGSDSEEEAAPEAVPGVKSSNSRGVGKVIGCGRAVEVQIGAPPATIPPSLPLLPGAVVRVVVLSAASPDRLVARLAWPEAVYRAMVQGLAPNHPAPWPSFPPKGPWPPVAALVEGRGWRRGLMLEEVGGASYRVFLCDEGEVAVLPAASLRPLLTCSLPRLALALRVQGVAPAGGRGWSAQATAVLAEAVVGEEVEVRVVGAGLPGLLPHYLVEVAVLHQAAEGPVEPSYTLREDLASRCAANPCSHDAFTSG